MELRKYQEEIAQKIDERFQGREREARRFVGVKLPTGGGKSFLFLDQFDKLIDVHNSETPTKNIFENPEACISTARVKYYAPLNGILEQTQVRVAEYILIDRYIDLFKKKYNLKKISDQDLPKAVNEISGRMVDSSKIRGKQKNQDALNQIQEIYLQKSNSGMGPEEILREVLEDALEVLVDNIDKLVSTEFPNLEFVCYQKNKSDVIEINMEELEKENPELVVFDEAHRNKMSNDEKGEEDKKEKKTWGEIAKELIRRLKRTKFLAITATPERDADGEDPMLEFADTARYTETELRKRDYLASDMALVSALEDGLVVKPDVVTFDCMLDRTKEYQEIEEKLLNAIKKSKQKDTITKKINAKTGKMEIVDDYHVLLLNFLKMNQLSGKLDFLQKNLQDKELVSAIEKLNDGSYVQENMEYFSTLEKLVKMIAQINQVVKKIDGHKELSEEDNEIYPLAFGYYQWQEEQVERIVSSTLSQRQYLQHGKYICFTPTSPSKEQTPELMRSYQKRMQQFLEIEAEDALITHSNSDVIAEAEDKRNLSRFTLKREKNRPPIAMVAMNKFNEGLHVDGVVASFMFRQFTEVSVALEDEKEEPKIIFLQQVGRCIHSIEPGEVVTEPPVIFDTACNFMRFNEKLNGLFQISPNQMEFKRLYDESMALAKSKGKKQTQEGVEEDIPKPKILDRILGIMQALAENGIDIEEITNETTWEEVEARIPEERREEVLDGIFVMTRKRMRPDYPIGSRIASARAAFWHTERQNPQSKSIKKLYNSKTDAFFAGKTFEELYQLGFFKDLERTEEFSKVSKEGFIIGECATPENFYGFNILTGTRYTKEYPERGILGVDVRGFSKAGIHIKTGIRYDEHFFRFDRRSGEWKNFFTGKDEDLLGFNHDGIRVNPEKGRVGFDRDRLWHKQLEDGSYSPVGSLYDEVGRDAFGFDKNNKAPDGTEYINGFMRVKKKDGTLSYLFRSGGPTDYDGYTIDGFDDKGFNREGIHRETGCRFDSTGMTIDKKNPKRRETYFPIKRIVEGTFLANEPDSKKRELITQRMLTQWIVLSQAYSKDMEQAEWYRVLKIKELQDRVRSMSNENSISQRILAEERIQMIQEKNETLQRQMEESEKLTEERNAKKAEISKLTSILQKIIQKREEDGGQEL